MGLQPGEILDGKYRIVRLVGEGGMGAVYQGENTRIKRRVAIKVLHGNVAEKTDVVQRFEREAQAAGRIGSEHIVEVLDLGNLPSGERFMVMEYLDGEDLTSRIKGRKRLTPVEAVPILHQVLEGLAAAHEAGIIHRDLKPDNIFILKNKAGRADFVKILDFGVSKFSALDSDMSMTKTGAVMGTPYYMSPEQAKGGKIDNRSDLYAIGVVLYQAITGRVPFNASSFNELLFKIALEQPEPIEELVPDCPPSFVAIVNKAMAREADHRFQSAREFQQALATWHATAAQAGGTVPLQAMPDMRAPMASAPMMEPSNPGLVHSNPGLAQSNPNMVQSNPGLAQSDAGLNQSQPSHPGMAASQTGQHGAQTGANLNASHSPLAITSHGKPRKNGMMVALIAAVVGILGFVAIGAYMLTRSPDSQAAPATTGAPDETAEPAETASPDDAETAETAETATPDDAETAEPVDSAEPADTAEPVETAEPKETSEPAAPPPPTPKPAVKPPPAPKPPPPPKPEPEPPKPQPTPQPGRSIKTEL